MRKWEAGPLLAVLGLCSCTPIDSPALVVEPGVCADTSNLFTPSAAAPADESAVSAFVYVDEASPSSSDANPGTEAQPLRTLSAAVALALTNNSRGIGTKVLIGAGTYRDQILLPADHATTSPLIFEAARPGQTRVSGADVWTGWQPDAGTGSYTHVWPYKWGLVAYPNGWTGNVVLRDIVRRREMVFVDDVPYTQVLAKKDLSAGTFLVPEPEALIYLRAAPGLDLNAATVEVSTRPELLHAGNRTNLVIRGIHFLRGNPTVQSGQANIMNSNQVTVENCQFSWSNWDGLNIVTSTNLTVRGNVMAHNGASGMEGYQLKNSLFENNIMSQNNWRGAQGGFYGWAVAGAKFGALHDAVFRNQRSEWNQARGFWFDSDHVRILIDGADWSNNYRDGVFVEANQGPILIRNSTLLNNRNGAGISVAASSDVTLAHNVIAGNQNSQLQLTGDLTRQVTNWESNSTYTVRGQRWLLTCNTIGNTDQHQLLFDTPNWPSFLTTLQLQKNAWYSGASATPFRIALTQFNYSDWVQRTK